MNVTNNLFRAARLSATVRAIFRGPAALFKRLIRIFIGRTWARTGIPRWPK